MYSIKLRSKGQIKIDNNVPYIVLRWQLKRIYKLSIFHIKNLAVELLELFVLWAF